MTEAPGVVLMPSGRPTPMLFDYSDYSFVLSRLYRMHVYECALRRNHFGPSHLFSLCLPAMVGSGSGNSSRRRRTWDERWNNSIGAAWRDVRLVVETAAGEASGSADGWREAEWEAPADGFR